MMIKVGEFCRQGSKGEELVDKKDPKRAGGNAAQTQREERTAHVGKDR